MKKESTINIRVDKDIKNQVEEISFEEPTGSPNPLCKVIPPGSNDDAIPVNEKHK